MNLSNFDPAEVFLRLLVLAFSVIIHEVAHGYVAYRLGDPTAKMANRLSLNPVDHIDPFGSIVLPLLLALTNSPVMLGWAKPVPINPGYFKHPKRDSILVSLAGVTANMGLAIAGGLVFRLLRPDAESTATVFLVQMCAMNVGLAVFNMVPIPPLDGSHVVAWLLPPQLAHKYVQLSRYGFLIIFGLVYLGLIDRLIMPIIWLLLMLLLG